MTTTAKFPYTVRQTKSGYTSGTKYLVFYKGQRVSVHAHFSTRSAWNVANGLNISDLVRPAAEDPRPYEVRRAEALAAFLAAGNTEDAKPVHPVTLPPLA